MNFKRKFVCLTSVFLIISCPFSSFSIASPIDTAYIKDSSFDDIQGAHRYNVQGWVYVYIEGDPYERGYQYGKLAPNEIVDLMNRWSNMIHNHPILKPLNGILSKDNYQKISDIWWNFCKKNIVEIYWDKFPEEYQNEIKGIAAGVNSEDGKFHGRSIDYQDVLVSNMMYEFLSKLTYHRLAKGFHPLLTLFKYLQEEISSLKNISPLTFILDFVDQPIHHKCNGFIATGDATTNGQIVMSNSMWSTGNGVGAWWWSYYITFRWNIVLDVNPSTGHRFQMATAPGYIWSDHDYYQNQEGILFLETTNQQGIWDNIGRPLAVRARLAVQYSENIDDVMYYLKYLNDGCMNAVWLIGDTKTGEIARFELGYRNSWCNRTFNGFHWSANNPMDFKVRLEKIHFRDIIIDALSYYLFHKGTRVYSFPKYRPSNRDRAFEELGNKYYGEIDIDIVKQIMSTKPMSPWSPDCKLSDTNLVNENGLWVLIGNPEGKVMQFENLDYPKISVENVPPAGWLRIFGLPTNCKQILKTTHEELGINPVIQWTYATSSDNNEFYSSSLIDNNIIYVTTSPGELLALNLDDGSLIMNISLSKNPTVPVISEDKLFLGTSTGLTILDLNWMTKGEKTIGKICSKAIVSEGKVIVGNENGELFAFDIDTGNILWQSNFPFEIYISEPWNSYIFVCSGKNCYKVNIETGITEWLFETGGMVTSCPQVFNDNVYFGSWDSHLYKISAESGILKWKYETGWGIETTPVVDNGNVFFGSHDNNFYSIYDNNGSLCWIFSCFSAIQSSPAVSDDNVIFGCDDGGVYCLNKSNSDLKWAFFPGYRMQGTKNYLTTPIISDPIVKDNVVYIGSIGNIYSIFV
ncbi:MAG: PQQ-like beta-propeller repeat protein [Candidatus Thermoplasmatota archaeon]|nr:PQQ-like beta-propeller repeat protein [Candidatus Thermoplasmatota archaeon]